MKSKKFEKNSIPKPMKKEKEEYHKKSLSKRKLSFTRNDNYLLNKYSNSNYQKSSSKTDLIKNLTNYNETSKIIDNEVSKRKLGKAKTAFLKFEDMNRKEGILKIKRKKVKNLQLLIKLVDENEKIEKEYYSNENKLKNFRQKIKFERNKSDFGLYIPSVTYNKKNIYFNKKYDLIQNKFNSVNKNTNKYIQTYSSEKRKSKEIDNYNDINIFFS